MCRNHGAQTTTITIDQVVFECCAECDVIVAVSTARPNQVCPDLLGLASGGSGDRKSVV